VNDDTLLLRQIHPGFMQDGRPSSQAFRPTPKDEQMLSVYDGDQITAANAFAHYTQTLKLESSGVMAVSVTECNELALPVRPDPAPLPRTCPDRLFLLQQERHRKENQTAQGKSSKTQLALPENVRMNTRKSGCTGQGILGGA
jgi:hypothetical protein